MSGKEGVKSEIEAERGARGQRKRKKRESKDDKTVANRAKEWNAEQNKGREGKKN